MGHCERRKTTGPCRYPVAPRPDGPHSGLMTTTTTPTTFRQLLQAIVCDRFLDASAAHAAIEEAFAAGTIDRRELALLERAVGA